MTTVYLYKIVAKHYFKVFILFSLLLNSCKNNFDGISENKKLTSSPNFILILADDQGWNGTSVQMMNKEPLSKSDYYETPNLEILANEGMKFSNAYSAAPVCAPSRYSIQFGKTPARLSLIRVGMNSDHIDHESTISIPKALKQINNNYQAAHFGKWGMGSHPSVLGYDISDGPNQNKAGGFVNNKEQWNYSIKEDPKNIFSITNKAVDFISTNVVNNTPFYLQLSHYAVHSSFQMTEHSLEKFKSKERGQYQKDAGLAAMTQDLDDGVGIILKKIKELGIEDNTYVIYMSDNGSVPNIPGAKKYINSYNYPLRRGKWDAMEGGVRVPLIVSGPGINQNTECNESVSGSDILPTIVSLAGGDKVEFNDIDGGSIKNNLFNNTNSKVIREVEGIFFHVPYRNGIALKRPHSAIIKGDFKLVKFQDNGESLLYNLYNDIKEEKNLSNIESQIKDSLEQTLDNYLIKVHAPKWKQGITWKKIPLDSINSNY